MSPDVTELRAVLGKVLIAGPDLDELTHLLFALLAGPLRMLGVGLLAPDSAPPRFLSHYAPDLARWRGPHVHGHTLPEVVLQALRGEPGLETHHHNDDRHTVAAWPLGPRNHPAAILFVMVDARTDAEVIASCLDSIQDVLSIYIAATARTWRWDSRSDHESSHESGAPALSPRQSQVLEGLAQGMTLRQISQRICFSESTVRAESLHIYRALGVHDREHAVEVAARLGLLAGEVSHVAPVELLPH